MDRGFSPITNKNKLANGQHSTQGFDTARTLLSFIIKRHIRAGTLDKYLAEVVGDWVLGTDVGKLIQEKMN